MEPGVRRGRAAVEAVFQALNESFEYSRLDVTRVVEIGDDVVAVVDTEGHGRGSQATFRQTIAHRFTFRNGKLVRLEWFSEPRKALEGAGLRE